MTRATRPRLPPTVWALGAATLIIAQQVAGKATRDALFLSRFDVAALPKVVMATAILSIVTVFVVARLIARHGPLRVISTAFAVSAACFVADWFAMPGWPRATAVALYLQMGVFGAMLISGFWSVVNERFDPYTARQTIAKVGAAATLGGVLGGLVAGEVPNAVDLRAMLLVLAGLHLACGYAVRAIGETPRARSAAATPGYGSGVRLLWSHDYLRWMGCVMVLVAVLGSVLDYALKSQAAASVASGEQLAGFFGQFYAAVGVLTFVIQSLLGPPVLKRFGIGVALAVMPLLTGLLGGAVLVLPRLGTVVAMRAAQMACGNSFFRAAFELLYTPLPPLTKRPTKAIIDVASDRLGDLLGSGLLLGLLWISPASTIRVPTALAMGCALLVLLVVVRLHRGYVAQLAASLREGAISLREEEIVDSTTRRTLAEASATSERALLMQRIRQLKSARRGAVEPAPVQRRASDELIGADPQAGSVARAIVELGSGDPARIRQCLHGGFMDPRLAPSLVPLLAHDALAEDVRMELRWMAPQLLGTFADAMSNPDLPLAARQRLPSVFEVVHSPRAVEALMQGLEDEEFNIRYSCARALTRMRARDPYMRIDQARVFSVVAREVQAEPTEWSARDLQFEIDLPEDLVATSTLETPPSNYSMEHVFTLLGLVLDREALSLALHAVASADRNLSGTALEYLEHVLPEDVRRALWPRLQLSARPSSRRGPPATPEGPGRGAPEPGAR